ncbi:MAG TPA: aspartate aminotransferase family protein [Candidatus Dormibacteraeota bacterium]|nr:aspartate aminotransferase family protein [Candidatus Dormibacteraeota bacterium]
MDGQEYLFRYSRDFAPFVVERAQGSWLWTTDGRKVLDFTSGQICSTLGHNHPRIVEAIARSLESVIHLNSWMLSEPVLALARRFAEIFPAPLRRSLFLTTGGEANEAAFKIAKMHTERFEIAGLARAWHGMSSAALSVNYAAGRHGVGPMMPGTLMLPAPHQYRCPIRHCSGSCDKTCLDVGFELLDQQSTGELAAVIAEPVLSAGGIIVPPPGYLAHLQEKCRERGALLIVDECQTGFGRLGTMFGFEGDGIVPDVVTVSKTLGGGIPIAAVVTTAAIERDCYDKGFLQITSHESDPLPAAAALAVIDVVVEEDLATRARLRGEYLMRRLSELQGRYEQIGDVRGRGLLVGMELVKDRETKEPAGELGHAVMEECLRCGLSMNIVRSGADTLGANCFRMAPPLSVSEEEIDTAVEILDQAMQRVLAKPAATR